MKQIPHPKMILRISVRKSNVVEFYEMVPIPDGPQVTLAGDTAPSNKFETVILRDRCISIRE